MLLSKLANLPEAEQKAYYNRLMTKARNMIIFKLAEVGTYDMLCLKLLLDNQMQEDYQAGFG